MASEGSKNYLGSTGLSGKRGRRLGGRKTKCPMKPNLRGGRERIIKEEKVWFCKYDGTIKRKEKSNELVLRLYYQNKEHAKRNGYDRRNNILARQP